MIRIIFLAVVMLTSSLVFADRTSTPGNSRSERQKNLPLPWTEISVGSATLNQTLDNQHTEHPLGFHVSAHSRLGPFHFGVGVLGAVHNEQQAAGTYAQVNIGESLYMETFNAGVILGNFIILDAGYGYAQFRRSVSNPYATPSTTTNVTANGMGWQAGGSIIPFRTNTTSFGLTYYYFDATSTSYSSDTTTGSTQTKATTPGKVHSSGSFAGASVLFNF